MKKIEIAEILSDLARKLDTLALMMYGRRYDELSGVKQSEVIAECVQHFRSADIDAVDFGLDET